MPDYPPGEVVLPPRRRDLRASDPLAHPSASAEELAHLNGWTLHQLRHAALTHDAEDATNTPTMLARRRLQVGGAWRW